MLLTKTAVGAAIVTWADAQPHLKANTADQVFVEGLILVATTYAEQWTGRAARPNSWTMLRDGFLEDDGGVMRVPLADVASVTSIKRSVAGVLTTVSSTVYQTKPYLSEALIVERSGQAWPTDADEIEHAVEVIVAQTCRAPVELFKGGILRHVAALWADRGDAEPALLAGAPDGWTRTSLQDSAKQSGAEALYASLRIPEM